MCQEKEEKVGRSHLCSEIRESSKDTDRENAALQVLHARIYIAKQSIHVTQKTFKDKSSLI